MHQTPLPLWRIILCTLAMCGVSVSYSAQINLGTPELLLLGLSERSVSLAWLAGPISGLLVQPIVGLLSDRCTSKFGRRRPFLVIGSLLTAFALILFSNVSNVASFFGHKQSALPLAVISFFLLDFSVQAVQGPLRALVTDVVPQPQRHIANAYIGVFTGLGNLFGSVFTAAKLSTHIPLFQSDTQAVFAFSAVILLVTVFICTVVTHEPPGRGAYSLVDDEDSDQDQELSRQPQHQSFLRALRNAPRPFWRVFIIQLFTWVGFFTLFVYINSWVGRNVFLGDGTAKSGTKERDTFDAGVRLGGKGNACTAMVTALYSLALPTLMRHCSVKGLYVIGLLVEAVVLMATPFIRGTPGQTEPSTGLKILTVTDIAAFGVLWGTTMGIPWTLIGNALDGEDWYRDNLGLFQMIFNASQSAPQLIVGIVAPLILALSGNDPSAVMFVGGVFALVGAVLIVVLRVGDDSYHAQRDNSSTDVLQHENWDESF